MKILASLLEKVVENVISNDTPNHGISKVHFSFFENIQYVKGIVGSWADVYAPHMNVRIANGAMCSKLIPLDKHPFGEAVSINLHVC